MVKYQHILVVIQPDAPHQVALERAAAVAALDSQAHLTALLVIYDFSYEMTAMLSKEERDEMRAGVQAERGEWLAEQLAPYQAKGLQCQAQVIWHNRPFECVLEQVVEQRFDLVVKATHQHSFLQKFIFTPTDWHLLRKCPAPLLLVKERQWRMGGQLIAAINCTSDEVEQQRLNDRITQEGLAVAALLGAELHLVNTYPNTPVQIAVDLPQFDPLAFDNAMREHHEHLLARHAAQYAGRIQHTLVREGLPEEVLPQLADELGASLMIMGCVGRTGLAAALLGNTAEHVVDRLRCDLLILKPDDYVCPLTATTS
ncbi:MAG: universal stress protein UspE [Aeromonas sp.]